MSAPLEIFIENVQEIWRVFDSEDSEGATFYVMYPLPTVAYIKGFRGRYSRELRNKIKEKLMAKGVTEVRYERIRGGKSFKHVTKK